MHPQLINHIQKTVALSDLEILVIGTYFKHETVKKKTHLLEEGQVCTKQYFILKGCCRNYIINQKGNEQTLQFGLENWWITDYMSFDSGKPSPFYIQAIENAEVLSIDKKSFEALLIQVPKLEKYFRTVLQKSFAAAQMRIKFLFTMGAEERYHHFSGNFPDFIQRVPQYMLASYLDFTPEFLSKIKKT